MKTTEVTTEVSKQRSLTLKLDKAQNRIERIRVVVLFSAMMALFIAQVIISPTIVQSPATLYNYIFKLIMSVVSIGFIASAVTLVIITGNNDLSTGAIMTLTAIMSCTFSTQFYKSMGPTVSGLFAIFIPLLVGAACGFINGLLVGVLKLNAFVSTMSTMYVFQGIAIIFNGGMTANGKKTAVYTWLGRGTIFSIPVPLILLLASFIILGFLLHKTVFGRQIFAVGGNSTAARFSGINSKKVVLITYVLAGLMAGLASVFIGSWTLSADMLLGTGKEFNAITAVVLGGAPLSGGMGTMLGTVLGVLFMGTLEMFYIQFNVSIMMQWLIRGCMLLAVIYINGILEQAKRRK